MQKLKVQTDVSSRVTLKACRSENVPWQRGKNDLKSFGMFNYQICSSKLKLNNENSKVRYEEPVKLHVQCFPLGNCVCIL